MTPTAQLPHRTRRPHPGRLRGAPVLTVGALAAALLLAGCSGDPEPEPTPEPSAGPLETLFADSLAEWSNEDVTRQLTRMEESIAACMADQGFTYTPVDYSALDVDFLGSDLDVEPGTLAFAERYGYGLTTDPWGIDAVGDSALEDPNAAYVAAMSEAEQSAYYEALYGPGYADPLAADDETFADYSWADAGCTGRAQQEMLAGSEDDDQFLALQQEMAAMMDSAANDPRLDRANADWAACMADTGYPGFSRVDDAEAAISAEVDAARGAAIAEAGTPAGLPDPAMVEDAVQEQLAEITAREIATAVADYTCRADVGYESLRSEIDHEYQRDFLAENQAEILEWLTSLESLRTGD